MKVIFLDIDGVLNTYKTQSTIGAPYISELENTCLDALLRILVAVPDCRVIIHSAWREELQAHQFVQIFQELGRMIISERIFGCTNAELSKADSIREQIRLLNLKDFVIIDDDRLFDLNDELYSKQYKTSFYTGLTYKGVDPIIKRLTNEI